MFWLSLVSTKFFSSLKHYPGPRYGCLFLGGSGSRGFVSGQGGRFRAGQFWVLIGAFFLFRVFPLLSYCVVKTDVKYIHARRCLPIVAFRWGG